MQIKQSISNALASINNFMNHVPVINVVNNAIHLIAKSVLSCFAPRHENATGYSGSADSSSRYVTYLKHHEYKDFFNNIFFLKNAPTHAEPADTETTVIRNEGPYSYTPLLDTYRTSYKTEADFVTFLLKANEIRQKAQNDKETITKSLADKRNGGIYNESEETMKMEIQEAQEGINNFDTLITNFHENERLIPVVINKKFAQQLLSANTEYAVYIDENTLKDIEDNPYN